MKFLCVEASKPILFVLYQNLQVLTQRDFTKQNLVPETENSPYNVKVPSTTEEEQRKLTINLR